MNRSSQAYNTIHKWISRKLGKAKECCNCENKTDMRYHWANISREYKRDLTDWMNLCASCHRSYDRIGYLPKWE